MEASIIIEKTEDKLKRITIINACLEQFVGKGLCGTTSRDLSKALNLKSAGMYSYFENKDDAIVACAEQAMLQLEHRLLDTVYSCITNNDIISLVPVKQLASQLSPMMRFLSQVCSTDRFEEQMRPILCELNKRYDKFITQLSEATAGDIDDIRPLVYIGISATINYMTYKDENCIDSVFPVVEKEFQKIMQNKKMKITSFISCVQ